MHVQQLYDYIVNAILEDPNLADTRPLLINKSVRFEAISLLSLKVLGISDKKFKQEKVRKLGRSLDYVLQQNDVSEEIRKRISERVELLASRYDAENMREDVRKLGF